MNKEFVPFEQALKLKELGFDVFFKDCYYDKKGELSYLMYHENFANIKTHCPAPLYQQAFRWFRDKYLLDSIIQPTYSTKYQYRVIKTKVQVYGDYMGKEFSSFEEAELECLKKLIELVKSK
jgi:hypothetical protein